MASTHGILIALSELPFVRALDRKLTAFHRDPVRP